MTGLSCEIQAMEDCGDGLFIDVGGGCLLPQANALTRWVVDGHDSQIRVDGVGLGKVESGGLLDFETEPRIAVNITLDRKRRRSVGNARLHAGQLEFCDRNLDVTIKTGQSARERAGAVGQ